MILHGTASSDLPQRSRLTDGEVEPSKATKAAVYEFGIRWPCPRDVDPDRYEARLKLLARDCAELAPGLLRKAGDKVARIPGRFNVLPSASEIHQAANELIAERAARQNAEQREAFNATGGVQIGDKAAAYHRANAACLAKGMKVMQTDDGELFKLGDKGERRGIRPDGSAIVPFFRHEGEVEGVPAGWYVRQEDAATLARCFNEYEADFHMAGARVLRNAA